MGPRWGGGNRGGGGAGGVNRGTGRNSGYQDYNNQGRNPQQGGRYQQQGGGDHYSYQQQRPADSSQQHQGQWRGGARGSGYRGGGRGGFGGRGRGDGGNRFGALADGQQQHQQPRQSSGLFGSNSSRNAGGTESFGSGQQAQGRFGGGGGRGRGRGRGGPPYQQQQQQQQQQDYRQVVQQDLQTDRPRWILSCYAFDRDESNYLKGDVSTEEVRFHDYCQSPLQSATHEQIYQLQQELKQAAALKQQDIEEVYQYVRASGRLPAAGATKQRPNAYVNKFQQATEALAGTPSGPVFGSAAATDTSNKPMFGRAAQQQQQQQGFGQAAAPVGGSTLFGSRAQQQQSAGFGSGAFGSAVAHTAGDSMADDAMFDTSPAGQLGDSSGGQMLFGKAAQQQQSGFGSTTGVGFGGGFGGVSGGSPGSGLFGSGGAGGAGLFGSSSAAKSTIFGKAAGAVAAGGGGGGGFGFGSGSTTGGGLFGSAAGSKPQVFFGVSATGGAATADDWVTGDITIAADSASPAAALPAVPEAATEATAATGSGEGAASQPCVGGMSAAEIAAAWQADKFELGKVPEVPPPPEVC